MAHGGDGPLPGRERRLQRVGRRARREALVDLELRQRLLGDRDRRLACAEERAGEHQARRSRVRGESLSQGARFLVAARRESAQVIRVAWIGMRMPDEEEEHG